MEETFMKSAKGTGGLRGLFDNYMSFQRWCRTISERAKLHEKMLEMCGKADTHREEKHSDLQAANIKKSKKAVTQVIAAICCFTNPWRTKNKDRLYSLASVPLFLKMQRMVFF